MTVQDVVDMYQENLAEYNFWADEQKAWIYKGHICALLRDYHHYMTKEKIEDAETAIRAILELERLDEQVTYRDEDELEDEIYRERLKFSHYWTDPWEWTDPDEE